MATQKSEAWVIHEQKHKDTIVLNEKIMQTQRTF